MLKNFNFHSTDTRVRRYIVPTRVVKTEGDVENAALLLTYRNRQIQLQDSELMTLRSTADKKAGI